MGSSPRRQPRPNRLSPGVYRRRRIGVGLTALCLLIVGVVVGTQLGPNGKAAKDSPAIRSNTPAGHDSAGSRPTAVKTGAAPPVPAIESGLMPWSLTSPLSRMNLFPWSSGVVMAGGLATSQSSASGVYTLDTSTGGLRQIDSLPHGVHDAAGAVVRGSYLVFGGGSPTTVATVQSFSNGTPSPPGSLPSPRSDATAVTVGSTVYIVGGFDGANPTLAVLATSDGRTFATVAHLAVPVRYPAVAAAGRYIYVFGGQSVGAGTTDGPVADIQRIDPADHQVSVVGQLPLPLEAASAVNLGGHIYLAGGEGPADAKPAEGVGTTQLDGWASANGAPSSGLATSDIWSFNPATAAVVPAGRLQVPTSHAGVAVTGNTAWLVGGENGSTMLATVQMMEPNPTFGAAGAPGAGSPYFGDKLLIADRGNNRLLLMDAAMNIDWTYPNATSPADPDGFYFPDDAFFARHGSVIISNQEENETIVQIAFPSGQITWSYGHPKIAGTAPGYLDEPDDAYLLRNGQITVADAQNCRVLVINSVGTVADQVGTDGVCVHHPPQSMGSPNGDTPLWDGNLLVSEINGSWVSEYTPSGQLVWTVQLPISYPSDPQQLGASPAVNSDRYLVADYASPGEILQFNRQGQVLSTYNVTSGPGRLNHPSLVEQLPNGIYLINDDYNHRMVAIDPATGALVWQYGLTGQAGTVAGQLNTPDGFDLLGPGSTTPTHPQTG
jgi:outer membrane protein assembly factor BamB